MKLHREFKLINEAVINIATNFIQSNWKQLADNGKPLFLIVTTAEEKRRDQQNRFYFGTVIRAIAEQAWVNGQQFSAESWHEYLAGKFGNHRDVTLPSGEVVVKRLSTTEMTVKEFSKYIEQVIAYGATEHGIKFHAPEYYA